MIKARLLTGDGRQIVLLGITEDNVRNLRAGRPILFQLDELGLGDGQGLVVYGATHQDLVTSLRRIDPTIPEVPDPGPGEVFRVRGD